MAQEATPLSDPLDLILELADLERPTWPARSLALKLAGTPLNAGDDDEQDDEDDDQDEDDRENADDEQDDDEQDDEDDDRQRSAAAKARREAAGLRKRLRTAETERDTLRTELDGKKDIETERDTAVQEARRLRAAFRAGLDLDLADRLRGDTDEELDADAESFVESTTPPKRRRGTAAEAGAGRRGKPARNYDPAAETDPQKVRENARKARRRSRDGD